VSERTARQTSGRKAFAAALAAVAFVWIIGRVASDPLLELLARVQAAGGIPGWLYLLGYAAATVLFIPGSILTIAAGVLFGVVRGTLIAFGGAMLGSSAAFLIARYVARPAVERRVAADERFLRVDEAVGRRGAWLVLLLRLSPVLPFNLLNYALGVTAVRFRDYLMGSIGMLPGTLLYVYAGWTIGELTALAAGVEVERDRWAYLLLGVGLLATVVAVVYLTAIARRALSEVTATPAATGPPDDRGAR
jgi:uncharacterized membrane protein YdjX (TVP38/TMEM64 family)